MKENIRTPIKLEIFEKYEEKKTIKQQSKLTLIGIHKSNENFDSYSIKQDIFLLDKPIYLGFAILELSK